MICSTGEEIDVKANSELNSAAPNPAPAPNPAEPAPIQKSNFAEPKQEIKQNEQKNDDITQKTIEKLKYTLKNLENPVVINAKGILVGEFDSKAS